ncbi:protein YgfX [Thiocystis violascens]|uniref:protein YgfX n=1 Tax=Thiocystis violascens TaxID=73141 RepID=UPI00059B57F0|nr:protein YgfX [Thiocystis violascens]
MASHRERPPLLIRPRRTWRLAVFAGLTHGLAGAVVFVLPIGLYRYPLWLLVGTGAFHAFAVHVLRRAPWSIRTALWQPDGDWLLTLNSGAEIEASLSPATFVSLPLVVLNFRSGRLRRHALPLFADALDPEQLRRLRQRLRMDGGARGPDLTDA